MRSAAGRGDHVREHGGSGGNCRRAAGDVLVGHQHLALQRLALIRFGDHVGF